MARGAIADLHASLSWDLDDFERGTAQIDNVFKGLIDKARALGERFRTVGRDMTVGLTLPIAGIVTSIAAMSRSTADDLKAMANAAALAGEEMDRFQRQAHAARSVGIEFDKLGDIFKDTRDKIGDFVATGGGEMADFFEKIAPQVGLTAESFRNLSGRDSLQLYYDALVAANVSQEEMVFYLEAIADEATALIPLLAANGAEFERLGAQANVFSEDEIESLRRYREAMHDIGIAMQNVVIAAVNSGLIDMLTQIAQQVSDWIRTLADTNPAVLRFAGGVAIAAAALGPLVFVLTSLAVVVLPLFLMRMGPVFFLLSALINPIGTVVVALGKLAGGLTGLVGGAGGALSMLGRLVLLLARAHPVTAALVTIFTLFGRDIVEALGRVWKMAQEALGPTFQRLVEHTGRHLSRVGELFEWIANSPFGRFIEVTLDLLGRLVAALIEIGGAAVIGAIDVLLNAFITAMEMIEQSFQIIFLLLQGEWQQAWDQAQQAVADAIENMLPSFQRLFRWIADALARLGILQERQNQLAAAQAAAEGATGNGVQGRNLGGARFAGAAQRTPVSVPAVGGGGSGGGGGGSARRSGPSEAELAARREELALEHQIALAREAGDDARLDALLRQRDLLDRIEDYERAGLSNTHARLEAERELAEMDQARRAAFIDSLTAEQSRLDLQQAQLRGDQAAIRSLEQELFLEEMIADLIERGADAAQAELIAAERLLQIEEARAEGIALRVADQERARQIELARLRGDDPEQLRALEEGDRIAGRIDDLMRERDLSRAEAEEVALREAADRSQAHLQGTFRDAFRGGLQAALDGDLASFFSRWLEDASFNALARVLDRLADRLADLVFEQQSGDGGGGLLGRLFGGLFGGQASGDSPSIKPSKPLNVPKFNTGGSFRVGGLDGVDRNILSLNGTPIARVSRGEIMDIRQGDQGGGRGFLEVRLTKGLDLEATLRGMAGQVFQERAPALGAATQQSTLAQMARMQSDRLE